MTTSKEHNVKLTSAGLLLRFDPRPHWFCSIIQSAADVLSDLIYEPFPQTVLHQEYWDGPSRALCSQTATLPFGKAQVSTQNRTPRLFVSSLMLIVAMLHLKKWNLQVMLRVRIYAGSITQYTRMRFQCVFWIRPLHIFKLAG